MPKNFRLPNYRFPCLHQGELKYVSLKHFEEPTFVLCCLSSLTERDAWLLESHAKEIRTAQGTLALLFPQVFPSTETWSRSLHEFDLPIFVDPLERLCRAFRLFRSIPSRRCESLMFDHEGRLKFRIIHHLNLRGLSTVLELAKNQRFLPVALTPSAPRSLPFPHPLPVKQAESNFGVPEPEVLARTS